jgi:hypothetical protein
MKVTYVLVSPSLKSITVSNVVMRDFLLSVGYKVLSYSFKK